MDRDFLLIGRLGAPKGVRGDLKLQSYSGESAHFRKLKEAELLGKDPATGSPRRLKLKIERLDGSGDGLTIAFAGYSSPEAARALTGLEILVPRSQAAPLGPNEWYVADLVGLSLVHEGKSLAKVRAVLEGGPDPWLEVQRTPEFEDQSSSAHRSRGTAKGNPEGISLVPFRKEFVGEVDLEAGTIELLEPRLLDEK